MQTRGTATANDLSPSLVIVLCAIELNENKTKLPASLLQFCFGFTAQCHVSLSAEANNFDDQNVADVAKGLNAVAFVRTYFASVAAVLS